MADIDKTIAELKRTEQFLIEYEFDGHIQQVHDAIELLKEQQETKERILRNIADNQLAVSPTGYETEEGLAKRTGEWNGLQMAYEIVEHDGN